MNSSQGWQSILWGYNIVGKGIQWQPNIGKSIFCKEDIWVPKSFLHPLRSNIRQTLPSVRPSNYLIKILPHGISIWFSRNIAHILSIPISIQRKKNKIVWHHSTSGIYSAKSSYHLTYFILNHQAAHWSRAQSDST